MATPGETTAEQLLAFSGVRRVPSLRIELFDRPGFLPPDLCAELIRLIDKDRRPSTIADPNGDHYFRTSETCDLSAEEPAVRDLEARLYALNRIDPAYGEPVQGQRYEVGQEFKAHTDYFEPDGQDFVKYCSVAGQRTWTFMVYLNGDFRGGQTRFDHWVRTINVIPCAGMALVFEHPLLHEGAPVIEGRKYVLRSDVMYRRGKA